MVYENVFSLFYSSSQPHFWSESTPHMAYLGENSPTQEIFWRPFWIFGRHLGFGNKKWIFIVHFAFLDLDIVGKHTKLDYMRWFQKYEFRPSAILDFSRHLGIGLAGKIFFDQNVLRWLNISQNRYKSHPIAIWVENMGRSLLFWPPFWILAAILKNIEKMGVSPFFIFFQMFFRSQNRWENLDRKKSHVLPGFALTTSFFFQNAQNCTSLVLHGAFQKTNFP